MAGRYHDILEQFSKILKFQLRIFKRFDGGWGSVDENGKWNGMIANLLNGEADFVATELELCCRRTEAADFLWTIDHPTYVFAIKS